METQQIFIIAGTGLAGNQYGPASVAAFSSPQGLCLSPNGEIFIADTQNHCISRIAEEAVEKIAGTGEAGSLDGANLEAQFDHPTSLCILSDGTMYVGDGKLNARLRSVRDGFVKTVFSAPSQHPEDPQVPQPPDNSTQNSSHLMTGPIKAVCSNLADGVYVAFDSVIGKLDENSLIQPIVTMPSTSSVGGLTFDRTGALYWTDTALHCIKKLDANSSVDQVIAGVIAQSGNVGGALGENRLSSPCGIAVAPDGRIFFSELESNDIKMIRNGNVSSIITLSSDLNRPTALAFDHQKSLLYVLDQGNHSIKGLRVSSQPPMQRSPSMPSSPPPRAPLPPLPPSAPLPPVPAPSQPDASTTAAPASFSPPPMARSNSISDITLQPGSRLSAAQYSTRRMSMAVEFRGSVGPRSFPKPPESNNRMSRELRPPRASVSLPNLPPVPPTLSDKDPELRQFMENPPPDVTSIPITAFLKDVAADAAVGTPTSRRQSVRMSVSLPRSPSAPAANTISSPVAPPKRPPPPLPPSGIPKLTVEEPPSMPKPTLAPPPAPPSERPTGRLSTHLSESGELTHSSASSSPRLSTPSRPLSMRNSDSYSNEFLDSILDPDLISPGFSSSSSSPSALRKLEEIEAFDEDEVFNFPTNPSPAPSPAPAPAPAPIQSHRKSISVTPSAIVDDAVLDSLLQLDTLLTRNSLRGKSQTIAAVLAQNDTTTTNEASDEPPPLQAVEAPLTAE